MVRRAVRHLSVLDPTIYPEAEELGESSLQTFIREVLRPLVAKWLAKRDVVAFTGSDQFIYYRQFNALARIAPDIYVLPGVEPGKRIGSWKIWERGIAPSFALEIVSLDVDKDYVEAPVRYSDAGASELVIFDPDYATSADRFRFQVYRRERNAHALMRVLATNEDRVRSKVLGCYLRATGAGEDVRVRIGTGSKGDVLLPTDFEEKELAERRVRELERKLERMRASRPRRPHKR